MFATLIRTNPTAIIRKNAFTGIEIIYTDSDQKKTVLFQIEAFIGNKWVLIDHDVNCKELNARSIISCAPIHVHQRKVLSFSLEDCEYIYSFPYQRYNKLLIRLKTVDYHSTKTSYYIGKTRRFMPFWINKQEQNTTSHQLTH
ncbi:hypothetical protein [Hymenobacter terricola]|uniref:hypothetical protein n=1 Tax=Hymenobacter terricola TaxID=2819236 RepID=UPI001B3116B2|nr:hypothetical protein [Hymenobacter terricola]